MKFHLKISDHHKQKNSKEETIKATSPYGLGAILTQDTLHLHKAPNTPQSDHVSDHSR